MQNAYTNEDLATLVEKLVSEMVSPVQILIKGSGDATSVHVYRDLHFVETLHTGSPLACAIAVSSYICGDETCI